MKAFIIHTSHQWKKDLQPCKNTKVLPYYSHPIFYFYFSGLVPFPFPRMTFSLGYQ